MRRHFEVDGGRVGGEADGEGLKTFLFILAAIGALLCFARLAWLLWQPRKPEGCWYKPTGWLRDDNYRPKKK